MMRLEESAGAMEECGLMVMYHQGTRITGHYVSHF